MPIFVIGGHKGGTGKSTVATNTAVVLTRVGRQVLLVDSDRQLTASNWSDVRQADETLPPITTCQKTGKLFKNLQDWGQRYDDVIVDAGGFDSMELRTALAAADFLYSPIQASQSDLWTVEKLGEQVVEVLEMNPRLQSFLVLSRAPTNPVVQETTQALALLAEYPAFRVCATILRDRKAFRDAMFRGRGVTELGDPKATSEMNAFTLEIMSHAGIRIQQTLAQSN